MSGETFGLSVVEVRAIQNCFQAGYFCEAAGKR